MHIATTVWRLSYITSRRRAKSFSESQRKLALIADQEDVLISGAGRRLALTHAKKLRILIRANVSIPTLTCVDLRCKNKDVYVCDIIRELLHS